MSNKIQKTIALCFSLLILAGLAFYFLQGLPDTANGENIVEGAKRIAVFTAEKIRGVDLSLEEAIWYKKLEGGDVQCVLCPRRCIIPEGMRGHCKARVNIDGKLRAITYGKPVAVHVDPIEKKPLFHFLPTTAAFSLAPVGCNLNCNFCQNWTISQTYPEEENHYNLPPEGIVKNALETGCKTIAYTYTEPTVHYKYMYDACKLAHENGLKNVFVTCGYINEEPLRELCKYMDGAAITLKGYSPGFYEDYCNATLEPVLRTLKIMLEEGLWVEIINLVIPDANDDMDDIREMCIWIRDSLGSDIPLHFTRFHPDYQLRDRPPTPLETLENAYRIAKEVGLKHVYLGNVRGKEGESTFCPNCGKLLIKRVGYMISDMNIENGKCKFCGEKIAGVWE
ncbi:AmmeMemoRadiSam system radical SAM enzyme [bacterium]|nr:AmmeMemoRadiSam system radical SAM enzyme [bacterium]